MIIEQEDINFCPYCGAILDDKKLKFCPYCGKLIKRDILAENELKKELEKRKKIRAIAFTFITAIALFFLLIFILINISISIKYKVNFSTFTKGFFLSYFLAFLPLIIIVPLLLWIDRYEPEPPILIYAAFLWGGLIATVFAYFLNTTGGVFLAYTLGQTLAKAMIPPFIAPLVEETLKGSIVFFIFLFFKDEFDNRIDGIIYAGFAGLGFEVFENGFYFFNFYLKGGINYLSYIFILRWIFGALNHVIFTSIFGASLGYFKEKRNNIKFLWIPIIGFLGAIFLHFLWNLIAVFSDIFKLGVIGIFFLDIFVLLPGFIGLSFIVFTTLRKESKVLNENLYTEVKNDFITKQQYYLITSLTERFKKGYEILIKQGFIKWLKYKRWLYLYTKLAFLKNYTKGLNFPDKKALDRIKLLKSEIEYLKKEIPFLL